MFWPSAIRAASVAVAISFFTVSADVCDEVADILNLDNIVPLGGVDTTIELAPSVTILECPANIDGELLGEILVSGGQLTIRSNNTVSFVNVRFTVKNGAELIFDMPKTKFGPNSGNSYNAHGFMLNVTEGGRAIFMGEFGGWEVDNVRSMFYNSGFMEFKGNATFQNNGNVFRSNEGSLIFRRETWFKYNNYLAIDNEGPDAFVRFSEDAVFQENARYFDGAEGCSIWNSEGNVVFQGDAYFVDHGCSEGAAVQNGGRMRFYRNANFSNNRNGIDSGAGLTNENGTLVFMAATMFNNNEAVKSGGGMSITGGEVTFKAATQFNNNQAATFGGGMSITGGKVTFEKAVNFYGNIAEGNGGAFSLTASDPTTSSSLMFETPSAVRYSDNEAPVNACTLAYVENGTTLVGFDVDDVCLENTGLGHILRSMAGMLWSSLST